MLERWLHDDTIQVKTAVTDWQQALDDCAATLLAAGAITPAYLEAITAQHRQLGPYYVLAPGLAMPHARLEEGAIALGLSLLKLHDGVAFGADGFDPVDVIIMLAAPDKNSHIDAIAALAELFSDDQAMTELHQAHSVEDIKMIIHRF